MSIVYKKKLKAGVLLYALFMAAAFSLLLQFYLSRQVSNQRIFQLGRERTQAFAMAVLARDEAKPEGQLSLKQGQVSYREKGRQLEVHSQLPQGQTYIFLFALDEKKAPPQSDKAEPADKEARSESPKDDQDDS